MEANHNSALLDRLKINPDVRKNLSLRLSHFVPWVGLNTFNHITEEDRKNYDSALELEHAVKGCILFTNSVAITAAASMGFGYGLYKAIEYLVQ